MKRVRGIMDIIPCKYPGPDVDPGKLQIQIVAGHVAKLGDAHESSFSVHQYPFLQDKSSQTYLYYQWLISCYREDIDVNRLVEIETYYATQYLRRSPLGYLDLNNFDKQFLLSLLQQNNASKESIRNLRKWCLDRAHSIASIAFLVYTHLVTVMQTPQDPACFDRIKNTLYALNDIFFNWKSAIYKGPYTSVLSAEEHAKSIDIITPFFTYLPTIIFYSLGMAQTPEHRQKINKLVEIWQTKDFLDASRYAYLHAAMSSPAPPAAPEYPTLYPISLTKEDIRPFKRPQEPVPFIPPPMPPGMRPPPPSLLPASVPPKEQIPYNTMQNMNHNYASHDTNYMYPPPGAYPPQLTPQNPYQHPHPHQPPAPYPTPHHMQPPSSQQNNILAPAAPAAPLTIDPLAITVGALADLVKGYHRCGGEPYTTIDPLHSAISINAHVEPGRLNVRLIDFYRKLETTMSLPPPPPPSSAPPSNPF